MTSVMSRDQLRARIDLLEQREGVMGAIEDVSGMELNGDDLIDVAMTAGSAKQAVAFAHSLPQSVVLAGLQAMKAELEKQIG